MKRKTVFVTGASNVTGKAIAVAFAKAGYDVGFSYLSHEDGAKEALALIEAAGVRGKYYKMDIRNVEPSVKTLHEFCDEFGPLDVMVNNTGLTTEWRMLDVTLDQFDRVSEINFRGTFFMMQAAARIMIDAGIKGSIVNISSVHAIGTLPRSTVYAATKSAICRMTRSAAMELSPYGITVNAFAPGYVDMHTDKNRYDTEEKLRACFEEQKELCKCFPLRHLQKPEEIGECVVFLASESARFITGQTLFAEGGVTIPIASAPEWFDLH